MSLIAGYSDILMRAFGFGSYGKLRKCYASEYYTAVGPLYWCL